ncbi:MAG: hypothetical protein ACE5KA_08255 [Nitrososphaerales archaeon]
MSKEGNSSLGLKAVMHKSSYVFVLLIATTLIQDAAAHQLFNSEEMKTGGYMIQIATDPEIPGPGNPSHLLVVISDYDGNDLIDVQAGLKIFKDDILIHEVTPRIYRVGHIDIEYAFPESGVYIVEVNVINPFGKVISSKFNIGIIQTFGYIFFTMVVIGATFPPTVIGIILLSKRRKAKQART